MDGKDIDLRNATVEETEILISWANKKCSQTRKGTLLILLIFLVPYIFLLIVNSIYLHSLIILGVVILMSVILLLFCAALYFYIAPNLSKKIESGAYKVQSGRIIDRNENNNTQGSENCTVVFESDNGDRAYININPKLYNTLKIGSCIILKWDNPKEQRYYRVIM